MGIGRDDMTNKIKLIALAIASTMFVGCGGGSSSDSDENIPNNLPDAISPELSPEFVPFKDTDILDKISDLFTGKTSSDTDYNRALGHMIGEVFGDYPYGRNGRLIQIYNMGVNVIKYPNLLCSTVSQGVGSKTLVLKSKNCVILDKTFKDNSKITQTVSGDTTSLEFSNIRYNSNTDLSLKDEYLISGVIEKTETKANNTSSVVYKITNLEYQRVTLNGSGSSGEIYDSRSREYLQAENYSYSLVSNGTDRKLSTKGKVIGQPLDAKFRYKLSYDTGNTPFVMTPLSTGSSLYNHLPASGQLVITDHYVKPNVIKVTQSTAGALKANIEFNNTPVGELLWSTIIGSK